MATNVFTGEVIYPFQPADSTWLLRLRDGNLVWLPQKNTSALVRTEWSPFVAIQPNRPDMGRLLLFVDGELQLWEVSHDGRGWDGSVIVQPVHGHLPTDIAFDPAGPELQLVRRQLSVALSEIVELRRAVFQRTSACFNELYEYVDLVYEAVTGKRAPQTQQELSNLLFEARKARYDADIQEVYGKHTDEMNGIPQLAEYMKQKAEQQQRERDARYAKSLTPEDDGVAYDEDDYGFAINYDELPQVDADVGDEAAKTADDALLHEMIDIIDVHDVIGDINEDCAVGSCGHQHDAGDITFHDQSLDNLTCDIAGDSTRPVQSHVQAQRTALAGMAGEISAARKLSETDPKVTK